MGKISATDKADLEKLYDFIAGKTKTSIEEVNSNKDCTKVECSEQEKYEAGLFDNECPPYDGENPWTSCTYGGGSIAIKNEGSDTCTIYRSEDVIDSTGTVIKQNPVMSDIYDTSADCETYQHIDPPEPERQICGYNPDTAEYIYCD